MQSVSPDYKARKQGKPTMPLKERLRRKENSMAEYIESDIIFINGKMYSKKELCLDWFQNSNDSFFQKYGFNFNPYKYPGLYEWGRKKLFGE